MIPMTGSQALAEGEGEGELSKSLWFVASHSQALSRPGRRRGRNVEGSEGESEVEAEEEEGEPEKAEKEPNEEE